jgi:hypothetical protein
MLWADFLYESALGFQPPKPSYIAPQQRLTLNNPRVVQKYSAVLQKEHARLCLNKRAFDLQAAVPSGLTSDHHCEYEKIAYLDDCARKHANKKCRKLCMGALAFSDTLKIAQGAIDLWDLLRRKRNGTRASTIKICRLMRLTSSRTALRESLRSIGIKRKKAMSSYKELNLASVLLKPKQKNAAQR